MGPATGVGGVAGVRRGGGGRCGWGPATGVGDVAGRKQ